MVKRVEITHYRKLNEIAFDFDAPISAISGSNGTCKSSLLHIIGNSYQAIKTTDPRLKNGACASLVRRLNSVVNPKIESLTKGDKTYNDPAPNQKGALYSVTFNDGYSLSFRRHNSSSGNKERFSVKPVYKAGEHESLPSAPVIYLGLSRLLPLGEYLDDGAVNTVSAFLPEHDQRVLFENYRKFTFIEAQNSKIQHMGDIKNRIDFSTKKEGVDSNTISAGEDNLFIILLALQTLDYYCNNLKEGESSEAILLIDELDATLHPAFQIKLIQLFKEYCQRNSNLQIIFTTHSMSLLEFMISQKMNVIYLYNNITDVVPMESPDMYKIRMDLQSKTHNDIYTKKTIPVFSEDEEARFFLKELFDYIGAHNQDFDHICKTLHMVQGKIGASNLSSLFKDPALTQSSMSSICILDGDKGSNPQYNIVALPGEKSPESVMFEYAQILVDADSDFWKNPTILGSGYSKTYYLANIQERIDSLEKEISEKESNGESTEGIRREKQKKIFNDNIEFFGYLMRCWLNDKQNEKSITKFYKSFHDVYLKAASYHGIDQAIWPKSSVLQIQQDE